MEQLFWSLLHRPYVTALLLCFLALSWYEQGRTRTLIWLISSYSVAFFAEWASINYGIPFGWYAYHYDALANDLVVFGVPFFDSLSFSFLSYVSFSFAQFFMSPLRVQGFDIQRITPSSVRNSPAVLLLGTLLMVAIDLIVDPIANLGRYWFLGDIYHYPDPGVHFGVTLANYGGWCVVALVTMASNQAVDRYLTTREHRLGTPLDLPHVPSMGLAAPLLWTCIVVFQLGVTVWVACCSDAPGIDTDRVLLQALTGGFIVTPIVALAAAQIAKPSNRVQRLGEIDLARSSSLEPHGNRRRRPAKGTAHKRRTVAMPERQGPNRRHMR